MVNYTFKIIARTTLSKEVVFRVSINEWHDLLFTLCPNFAASTRKFKFNREDVLTSEEIKLFEKVSYSEHATSVVEGYETYRAPNFESGYIWKNIFKKVEEQFFRTQNIDFLTKIYNAENDESKISETIQRIRVFQSIFDQIKQTLNIADKNNFEIAFTIHDY